MLEHVNVKLYGEATGPVEWHALIPVFHRWIQSQAFPELLLVDVADYSHVPAGPGVMLIGHHANLSVDNRENRLGFLYNRKTVFEGDAATKLRHSVELATAAARKLQSEPEFAGKLSFRPDEMEIFVNDRLLAPNTEATWASLGPLFESTFPGAHLRWRENPRDLFRVKVTSAPQRESVPA